MFGRVCAWPYFRQRGTGILPVSYSTGWKPVPQASILASPTPVAHNYGLSAPSFRHFPLLRTLLCPPEVKSKFSSPRAFLGCWLWPWAASAEAGHGPIEAERHRDPDRRPGLSRRGRLRGQGHPYAAHRLPGPQRHAVYQRLLGLPGVHPGAGGALDRALPAALRPGMGDFSRSEDGQDPVRPGRSRKDAGRLAAGTGVRHGGLGKVAPGRSTAVPSHQARLRLLLRLPAMGPLLSQSHPGGACPSDRPLDLVVQVRGRRGHGPLHGRRLQQPGVSERAGRRFSGLLDRRSQPGGGAVHRAEQGPAVLPVPGPRGAARAGPGDREVPQPFSQALRREAAPDLRGGAQRDRRRRRGDPRQAAGTWTWKRTR